MPPGEGLLPVNTHLTNMPQGSSILIDNCAIDSYSTMNGNSNSWNTSIFLEQLPQVMIVRQSLGLGYTPAFSGFPYKLPLSLVRVSPLIDLDGPQLDCKCSVCSPRCIRTAFAIIIYLY